MDTEIRHYGTPRHSGRYPWGSGKDPYQDDASFLAKVDQLRKQGLSEVEIARGMGMKTTQLRAKKSLAKTEERNAKASEALRLKEKGYSNVEIGRRMGIQESSVRSLLDPTLQARSEITRATSNMLKESVASKTYIDIGAGVENHIGVSKTKLNTAIAELKEEGYRVFHVQVEQVNNPGKKTTIKVLAGPDATFSEVYKNKDKIQSVSDYSDDFGRTYTTNLGLKPVQSVDSKRIKVLYADDGGSAKDGVIELRRDVPDLDMGNAKYAQVRIGVDGTHYLKGMAIYRDDMPPGVDIVFNTNKKNTGTKTDAFKVMKDDPDNPFGATIKVDGQKGALNIVNEEGDWSRWSKTISSQVLSKQTPALAKQQLDLAYKLKKEEFDELTRLTNPVVKKQLLNSFAEDADSASVHLKAAALPRQASKVILPVPELKDNEVYAPSFRNGETVVLIRHPHGGTFEIPQLVVNNRSKAAKTIMANAEDAVGINPRVAQKLSGADFDGDTVIVIPNNSGIIKATSSLKGLTNFDPISAYPGYSGMKKINPKTKQTKMGEISNLITDMTIKGANTDEIARAVRHSMVVIDSEKHNLNYKQSYVDNGIATLSEKYQGSKRGGASTLISKASSEKRVEEKKPRSAAEGGPIDPATGKLMYTKTGATYVDKKGATVVKTTRSTKMAEADDAFTLSSGTPMESIYAGYANSLKALGNTARKEALSTKNTPYSPSAKQAYNVEVATLNAKLNVAAKNKPLERKAQLIANSVVEQKVKANPDMDPSDLKKIKNQAIVEARVRAGAKKYPIDITPKEWEAIQAGAVSTHKLTEILQNTDLNKVKQYATPRTPSSISSARITRAKAMLASGATQAEAAEAIGVSTSTLMDALR